MKVESSLFLSVILITSKEQFFPVNFYAHLLSKLCIAQSQYVMYTKKIEIKTWPSVNIDWYPMSDHVGQWG